MAIDNFPKFSQLVAADFQNITEAEAYVVGIEPDALWQHYLKSFPEGTNPQYKDRTEHDCSCCKHFVRHAGNVVSVKSDGSLRTVWDNAAEKAEAHYKEVAIAMRDLVRAAQISNLFRVSKKENSFGTQQSRAIDKASGNLITWDHFYSGPLPKNFQVEKPDEICGNYRTTVDVFRRGLEELKPDAIETILSLIDASGDAKLYRGAEFRDAVVDFQKAQQAYEKKNLIGKALFVWTNAVGKASRFRNSVIGTLAQDLSEGKELDKAVASFEAKVAPTNYKRTTALITPMMVKKAMEEIKALDLESALERRFAKIDDISINDVLWVDGKVRSLMKGGLSDLLMEVAVSTKDNSSDEERAEKISAEEFIKNILPKTTGMELLFKGHHVGNLVSLTAPVHAEPKQLFKWNNDFGYSYTGNVADSIKERVKKAGGKVDGVEMRFSLSWFNYDDLDIHVLQPPGKGISALQNEIAFNNKTGYTGGCLDIDMNAGTGRTRNAVENVRWTKMPPDGPYKIIINNFNQRETVDTGFVVEMEFKGKLSHFTYNKTVKHQQNIHVATIHIKKGALEKIEVGDDAITTSAVSQDKWGIKTETYRKVNAMTYSPNYWGDNAVGNKHIFFFLDGAKSDEPTRGIYNEFLHARHEKHRKVFEVIGDKTKCQPTDDQLSGLGFSSTKADEVIVKVYQEKRQRIFAVQFGV